MAIASPSGIEAAIIKKGHIEMGREYTKGAKVVGLDGYDIGVVDRIEDEELVVLRTRDGRTMHVPFDVVDEALSSPDRIVLQGAVSEDDDEQGNPQAAEAGDVQTLPLVGEEAVAHVYEVDRGQVVIDKRVEMVPHEANVDVGTDRVDVERVPINEEMDTAPTTRQEGDTLIVPVIEEVLVVTKRYRVIEEVRVRKYRDVETRTFDEDLKREVVDVREVNEEGEVVDR